ncbi:hypothetical protein D5018_02125 [Parashewanella curva]|uniref:Uncharacterized protein n=1 Tax=Parashewanella curva TaxID=2338552 RepID=A0A3L8Q0Y4_9GAMM|nr:hypothetical protein [Parashewanella curva]RLV61296.1 hypothetical protein D5018_02125 [Parashewanella curva]
MSQLSISNNAPRQANINLEAFKKPSVDSQGSESGVAETGVVAKSTFRQIFDRIWNGIRSIGTGISINDVEKKLTQISKATNYGELNALTNELNSMYESEQQHFYLKVVEDPISGVSFMQCHARLDNGDELAISNPVAFKPVNAHQSGRKYETLKEDFCNN